MCYYVGTWRAKTCATRVQVRVDILGHARIRYVGKSQSCMFSNSRLIPHAHRTGKPFQILHLNLPPGSLVSFPAHMPHFVAPRKAGAGVRWGLLLTYRYRIVLVRQIYLVRVRWKTIGHVEIHA